MALGGKGRDAAGDLEKVLGLDTRREMRPMPNGIPSDLCDEVRVEQRVEPVLVACGQRRVERAPDRNGLCPTSTSLHQYATPHAGAT
jgi:hypothetical protein